MSELVLLEGTASDGAIISIDALYTPSDCLALGPELFDLENMTASGEASISGSTLSINSTSGNGGAGNASLDIEAGEYYRVALPIQTLTGDNDGVVNYLGNTIGTWRRDETGTFVEIIRAAAPYVYNIILQGDEIHATIDLSGVSVRKLII